MYAIEEAARTARLHEKLMGKHRDDDVKNEGDSDLVKIEEDVEEVEVEGEVKEGEHQYFPSLFLCLCSQLPLQFSKLIHPHFKQAWKSTTSHQPRSQLPVLETHVVRLGDCPRACPHDRRERATTDKE